MNNLLKIVSLTVILAITSVSMYSITPYNTLEEKADRFYQHHEWTSALAMYELMLDQQPTQISVYARAIIAGGMMNKPEIQLHLMQRTGNVGIPIDSVFTQVSRDAFTIGHPHIYEQFLMQIRDKQPWYIRVVNTYLLRYYTFRNEADKMIEISEMLLKVTPDNTLYLQTLGDAYCLKGNLAEGIGWYKKVLTFEPNNYKALLTIGNYYNITLRKRLENDVEQIASISLPEEEKLDIIAENDSIAIKLLSSRAIDYLSKAYKISPTPYVEKMLLDLNKLAIPTEQKKRH